MCQQRESPLSLLRRGKGGWGDRGRMADVPKNAKIALASDPSTRKRASRSPRSSVVLTQKYDVFNRSVWDESVHSDKAVRFYESYFTDMATFRKVEGFTHRDYALRNASWYIADFTADLLEQSSDRKEGFWIPTPCSVRVQPSAWRVSRRRR